MSCESGHGPQKFSSIKALLKDVYAKKKGKKKKKKKDESADKTSHSHGEY